MRKKQPDRIPRETPDEFCEWWNPTGVEQPSGASVGGHPDAKRVWARKEPGRWNRRTYGIAAVLAWQIGSYREEFYAWVEAGKPRREEFVSLAVSLPELEERMKVIKAKLGLVAKPVPKVLPNEVSPESLQRQKVEVLNEEDEDGSIPF